MAHCRLGTIWHQGRQTESCWNSEQEVSASGREQGLGLSQRADGWTDGRSAHRQGGEEEGHPLAEDTLLEGDGDLSGVGAGGGGNEVAQISQSINHVS